MILVLKIKLLVRLYRYQVILRRERFTVPDKAHFLVIAKGSVGEFKTQTDIGIAIGYINKQRGLHWMNEAEQLPKMLGSFINRLKNNDK